MAHRIEALLGAGESASVEFKRSLSDTRKIVETIAAMATIGGGTVLVGVRDDGAVVGVEPGDGEIERLVQQVLAGTDPKVFVDVDRPVHHGRPLICLRVPPGDGPHLAFGRAFYRVGPATVAMTRDEYERRLLDRLRESSGFERRLEPGAPTSEIDPEAVAAFRERAARRAGTPLPTEGAAEVLDRLHLLAGERLTVGGTLLFARDPQGPLPQAVIRAVARRGADDDTASIEGNLFRQIDGAVAFVARNLRHRPVRTAVQREEVPEIPLAAVREVVANAVAHRDYRSTAPVQLRLDDGGLDVWNPGHLPPPLTVQSLREVHPSIPTNPYVARALYLAGYIEEWGTGTNRVIEAMREAGNPEPLFERTGEDGIRVRLPLPGTLPDGIPARAVAAVAGFVAGVPFRSAEYAVRAGVSVRTAAADLAALESAGAVRRVGTGRATRWVRAG